MSRWGECNDLHQVDEMAETPQDTVVTKPLPGCFYFPPISHNATLNNVSNTTVFKVLHSNSG